MTLLTGHIYPQRQVAEPIREEMLQLHRRYYLHVARERFRRDLSEKDWVLLMLDAAGRVGGFSTARLLPVSVDGQKRVFLFSGDTVMDRPYWSTSVLPACYCHLMARLIRDEGESDLHWFLITKGYRTYRYLPVYFREFFPRADAPTPAGVQRLLDAVARHKFGTAYDPATGVISTPGERDALTKELAAVPPHRQRDRHVAFFLRRNPGHAEGNELACLARISYGNFGPAIRRMLARTRVAWHEE
jgi:hypothetical protein